ncbi:hypothetical protein WH47_08439 [Habropoda laboriosa]|uniref:Uncharacterized protein n=1 Tax=Habropoda laboriosa TaxID=597456 RepID=A0A0L7RFQ3_9HYME|nr:hypothetical protein WH47_08439 [Habropoda laboriosa]
METKGEGALMNCHFPIDRLPNNCLLFIVERSGLWHGREEEAVFVIRILITVTKCLAITKGLPKGRHRTVATVRTPAKSYLAEVPCCRQTSPLEAQDIATPSPSVHIEEERGDLEGASLPSTGEQRITMTVRTASSDRTHRTTVTVMQNHDDTMVFPLREGFGAGVMSDFSPLRGKAQGDVSAVPLIGSPWPSDSWVP